MKACLRQFGFAVISIFVLYSDSRAQFTSPDSLAQTWSAEPGLWSLVKVLLLLGLVLGLVWVSLNALRKVTGKSAGTLKGVEIVGGVPLGPRRSLVFVKIARRVHIIGATDQHLTAIGVIDNPDEVAELLSSGLPGSVPQFKDIFNKLTRPTAPSSKSGDTREA